MIPDEVVERVRQEAEIISVIGEFVKLKRVGNSFRGPCPFHHGKNANFSVSAKGGYKCFVCGESGDVFTFVQKHLGLDFVESVKWVGAKVGVEVPDVARGQEERDTREPLWEVNATAAAFFREQLWNAEAGKQAREYLASRGLAQEEADRFGLGYAPRDRASLMDALRALGFGDDRQLEAGLLVVTEERPEPRPRFRDRLIFPIYDPSDRVVGFGGRVLAGGEPKYLNSAESKVYAKRSLLYGLNWAKQSIRKADRLVIVEGYFDVIRLMAAGVTETVAPLGTALTEQQAALIRKYTKNVFLLYDSDQAGLKATFRAGDVLLAAGASVRVISLPDGEDPDTFVAKFGAGAFERAAGESVDVFDRKIQILDRGGWFADLRRKREALDKLLPTIRVATDPLLRDLYISRTSDVAGVSRDMLVRELSRQPRGRETPEPEGAPPARRDGPSVAVERRSNRPRRGIRAERQLIRALLHHRRFIESVAERIGESAFADPIYGGIFAELAAGDADVPADALAAALDDASVAVLQELLDEAGGLDRPDEIVNGSVNAMLSRQMSRDLAEIDRLLPLAESEEKDRLIGRKKRLQAELSALGQPRWKQFNPT